MGYNYKTLNLEQMKEYIEQNAPQDKEWFKGVAFVETYPKKVVYLFNPDGTPKMKMSKKTGKEYHAKELIDDLSGTPKMQFNLLEAKEAFVERYMPEIKPEKKAPKEKKSDFLKDW